MIITHHEYNLGLVLLSYIVASIASFTALELARRVTQARGVAATWWLVAGACSMGTGIWSMHFIGMLAYKAHTPLSYDVPITLLSLAVAIVSSAFALYIGSRGVVRAMRLAASGTLMGAGIAGMHYTGMQAMRMEAAVHYDPTLFALSIVIAVVVSAVALWLVFKFSSQAQEARFRYKVAAALVMGFAICGMHYTGMEAVYYTTDHLLHGASAPAMENLWLATSVGLATLIILGATLIIVFFDRKLSAQTALGKQLEQLVEARTAELFLEKERAEVTLDSIADAVITTDADARVAHLNPVAQQLTGWKEEAAKGLALRHVVNVVNEGTREPMADLAFAVIQQGRPLTVSAHAVLISKDGREFAIDESAAPILNRDGGAIGAVLVFRDVSAKRELTRQLSHEATHDALTGLINRRELEARLRAAIRSARDENREHALLYLDLDHFKLVNDTCGHVAGDELLKRLSKLLSDAVRESDMVARLGGDEFGVLLHRCPLARAKEVAEKLRRLVEEFRFTWEGRVFTVTASVGISPINGASQGLAQILSAADSACYLAKESGRNTIRVFQESDEQLTRRANEMEWATRIRRGLDENRFVLYRQRILPLHAPEHEGEHFEILLRLRDEQDRLLPPMSFIPAAERYGLMPVIDRWVVANVLKTLVRRRATGVPLRTCAINLSGQSLGEDNFLSFVLEQLDLSGVDPGMLCFEITETAAIGNLERAKIFISSLRARGCRFALDDFGTGLSSFAYLKNLSVDYLKIDGNFVKGMAENELDEAIVLAVSRIARVLGIRTIAEFVENNRIMLKLEEIGVDFAQGYGIAKPEPLEEDGPEAATEPMRRAATGN